MPPNQDSPELNPFSTTGTSYQAPGNPGGGLLAPTQARGMVGQAPILGVLMIVQGVLDVIAGVFAGVYGVFMPTILEQAQKGQPNNGPPIPAGFLENFMLVAVAVAIGLTLIGILNVVAGFGVMSFHRRTLAFIALAMNMLTLFTCYCFPTSFLLSIYGLIFLLNQPVSLAFSLRAQGHDARRIRQAFTLQP